MTTIEELREIFIEKLRKTGSFDEAIMKVAWVAFNRGIEAERNSNAVPDTVSELQPISPPQGVSCSWRRCKTHMQTMSQKDSCRESENQVSY